MKIKPENVPLTCDCFILCSQIGKGDSLLCVLFRFFEKEGKLTDRQRQIQRDTEGDLKLRKRKRLQIGNDPRACRNSFFFFFFCLLVGSLQSSTSTRGWGGKWGWL